MKKNKEDQQSPRYFPHINVQTNSNLSFSLIKISQLVNWATERKIKCLSITDYYPYEFLKFYNLCKEKKIKPIIGIKVIIKENEKEYLLAIYPQNSAGYKDTIKKIFDNETLENRIFSLEKALSLKKNCLLIFVANNLEDIKYFSQKSFFSTEKESNFYIGFNFFIKDVKKNVSSDVLLSLLPFFSVVSFSPEENFFLELLRESSLSNHFLPEDLQQKLTYYSKEERFLASCTNDKVLTKVLLSQTQDFFSKINLKFLPITKKNTDEVEKKSFTELQDKCFKQLLFLQKESQEKYENRLESELQIINKLNYSHYFLVFSKIIDYLRKENIITGPGRGSAVSSLVVYLLGITKIDPLEHNLFFGRFLNEKRTRPPDIDIDVENQEVVWNYLKRKYGEEKIARIATRQKLGWKNALKECAEVIKRKKIKPLISEDDLKEIINLVKEDILQENLKTDFFQSKYKFLFNMASRIKDLFFNSSIHPSGIIISEKEPLTKLIPLEKKKDFLISYYSEEDFSWLGLKKYDFLSLDSLRVLSEVKRVLQKKNLPKCNFQDKETWKLINNCLVTDVPQLDTISFRNLITKFQPHNFNELVLLLALNRPGARQNVEMIWERRTKNQNKAFSSPILNQILGESYGFIVFEEQVSQILTFVFDYSFAEAEIQRRSLSKVKSEELEVIQNNFLEKAKEKITSNERKKVWEQIINNNAYTFNKSHAVAYGYLCYYIAYLKTNYFPSLITHYLESNLNSPEKTLSYFREAVFYGFSIQKPDINFSENQWNKKQKTLTMSFKSLKSYPADFFAEIIEEREKGNFKDWEDLISRTKGKWEKISLPVFQEWMEADLFASLQIKTDTLLKYKETIFRYLQLRKEFSSSWHDLPALDWLSMKSEMNSNQNNFLVNQKEKENLGNYISYFNRWKQARTKLPLVIFAEIINNLAKFDNRDNLSYIYVVIQDIQSKRDVFWLILQDLRSTIRLTINREFYQQNQEILKLHQEVLCQLVIKISNQQIKSIQIQKIELIELNN